jgi:hypothetical protein
MATRLEQGQMQVRSVGGAPMQQVQMQQVSPVGYQAQASTAEALSRVLDRMGQTAFQMAGEQQQQRAFADVVNNPITPQQIEAAKNGDVSNLQLGGTINMYDVALRKARSFELSSRFETEAKNEAVKIMADIDAGNMNSVQAAEKMNVLTNGYAKSLAGVDAEAALKFTASMGIYGSTIVAKAYEHETKKRKEKDALAVLGDFDNTIKLVQPMLEQGVYTNSAGEMRPTTDLVEVARKNLTDRAFAAGGLSFAREYQTKFDAEVKQAKINVLSKHFIGESGTEIDQNAVLDKLKTGNAGKLSHVLQEMLATDFDSVVKVESQILAAAGHRHQVSERLRAEEKLKAEAQAVGLMTQIYALPEGDARRRSLANQLATIAKSSPGSVPMSVIKDVFAPNQDSNAQVLFNTKDDIFSGKITDSAQIWERTKTGLSQKDAASLVSLFYNEDRRDAATLERGLAKIAGINVTPGMPVLFDPKGAEAQRLNELRSSALTMQAKAAADGKPITSTEILRTLEDDAFKKKQTNEAQDAKSKLEKNYAPKYGEITREKLSALRQKHKDDRNKMSDIERMEKLLDQSEGKK